jgi:hypothetical protein
VCAAEERRIEVLAADKMEQRLNLLIADAGSTWSFQVQS